MSEIEQWIKVFQPRESAPFKILCFPYAGGGASAYRHWPEFLTDKIELWAVQLPGREDRIQEAFYDSVESITKELLKVINKKMDTPFVLFGHSMGAVLAYEFAKILKKNGMNDPKHLYLSGRKSVNYSSKQRQFSKMSDKELEWMAIHKLGSSNKIAEHPELQKIFLRTLRADFKMIESYKASDDIKLTCPVSVFYGLSDESYTEEQYKAWNCITDGKFKSKAFQGGHQFASENIEVVVQAILKDMA